MGKSGVARGWVWLMPTLLIAHHQSYRRCKVTEVNEHGLSARTLDVGRSEYAADSQKVVRVGSLKANMSRGTRSNSTPTRLSSAMASRRESRAYSTGLNTLQEFETLRKNFKVSNDRLAKYDIPTLQHEPSRSLLIIERIMSFSSRSLHSTSNYTIALARTSSCEMK